MLELVPIEFTEACLFIEQHHRHHKPPQGHKFSIAASLNDSICGVVIVGRPVSRILQDGWTLEVTRLCSDGTKNVCSKLYAAAWNATKAMGYRQLVTYTLNSESGTSVKAAGWHLVGSTKGGSWNRSDRPRIDKHPLQSKLKWIANAKTNR